MLLFIPLTARMRASMINHTFHAAKQTARYFHFKNQSFPFFKQPDERQASPSKPKHTSALHIIVINSNLTQAVCSSRWKLWTGLTFLQPDVERRQTSWLQIGKKGVLKIKHFTESECQSSRTCSLAFYGCSQDKATCPGSHSILSSSWIAIQKTEWNTGHFIRYTCWPKSLNSQSHGSNSMHSGMWT